MCTGVCLGTGPWERDLWGTGNSSGALPPALRCVSLGLLPSTWHWLPLGAVQCCSASPFSSSEGFSEKCSMRGEQSACLLCCLLEPALLSSANTNGNLCLTVVAHSQRDVLFVPGSISCAHSDLHFKMLCLSDTGGCPAHHWAAEPFV